MPDAPATMAAADTVPDAVTDAALSVPTVLNAAAVMAADDVTPAARSRPVTLALFMTSAPTTDAVLVTSFRMTTDVADGPTRTTPVVLPVPASRTRSPPTDAL